jgi:hypothetical protein
MGNPTSHFSVPASPLFWPGLFALVVERIKWATRFQCRYDLALPPSPNLLPGLLAFDAGPSGVFSMSPEEYRVRAEECQASANVTLDRAARESFEHLARQWRKFAELLERGPTKTRRW